MHCRPQWSPCRRRTKAINGSLLKSRGRLPAWWGGPFLLKSQRPERRGKPPAGAISILPSNTETPD
jgi:hypothetical protein